MTDWVIETGIPIPPKDTAKKFGVRGTPSDLTKAFAEMKPLQSLFTSSLDRTRVTASYKGLEHYHGYKFTSRAMDGGVRVWRVK